MSLGSYIFAYTALVKDYVYFASIFSFYIFSIGLLFPNAAMSNVLFLFWVLSFDCHVMMFLGILLVMMTSSGRMSSSWAKCLKGGMRVQIHAHFNRLFYFAKCTNFSTCKGVHFHHLLPITSCHGTYYMIFPVTNFLVWKFTWENPVFHQGLRC